jgi:carboxyl-terminal processing protease
MSLFFSEVSAQQDKIKFWQQSNELVMMFEKQHYSPVIMDAATSESIYNSCIHTMDPYGLYFTEKDLAPFNMYKSTFVDELRKQGNLIGDLTLLYKKALLRADSMIDEICKTPCDMNRADTIHFVPSTTPAYSENTRALYKRWTKNLKYQVLEALFTPAEENDDPFAKDNKTLLVKEAEMRVKTQNRNKKKLKKIIDHPEGFETHVASIVLNCIAERYDPHSAFFSPVDKNSFQQSLSSEELSFGLALNENDKGEISVAQLLPGGAAWKSNQLNEGDILVKLSLPDGKKIDATIVSIDEVESALGLSTMLKAEFTIRKSNGQVKTFTLKKEKIETSDNVVRSYVLKGEKNIGYISLPSFYTQWENTGKLGCANDVAKELVKLQEEKIDGLILDVRSNGGGSLHEALDLAGIFIDEGPLCIYKGRETKPVLLKDMNRGTIYDGPLILMVNGFSASASELLAAALKDYKRAVIVGSTTYGKATAQTILPLDANYDLKAQGGKEPRGDLGYVKITMEKFYRVTSQSHQKKGIEADINLPDLTFTYNFKESSNEFALPSDSVNKKVTYTPYPELPVSSLADESKKRLSGNASFKRIQIFGDSINQANKKTEDVCLKIDDYRMYRKKLSGAVKSLERSDNIASTAFKASDNAYNEKINKMDEYANEMNLVTLKNIQEDIYIDESYKIMLDLIGILKK